MFFALRTMETLNLVGTFWADLYDAVWAGVAQAV
jgi:hypothetical protein